jgi:hypothetical protein
MQSVLINKCYVLHKGNYLTTDYTDYTDAKCRLSGTSRFILAVPHKYPVFSRVYAAENICVFCVICGF